MRISIYSIISPPLVKLSAKLQRFILWGKYPANNLGHVNDFYNNLENHLGVL